ncbi:MAG: TonB C-terminal domain-containing protein [Cyanobacteria bacterium HKST-UBA02]|nr:TonB C-terminal domain-containing protein [Cyanobacteria bacterium HKST-UBA02]
MRRLILVFVVILASIPSPVWSRADTAAWSTSVSMASFLMANHEYKSAEDMLNAATRLATTPYELYAAGRMLAQLYEQQNKLDQAVKVYGWCYDMRTKSGDDVYDSLERLYRLNVKLGRNKDAMRWRALLLRNQSSAGSDDGQFLGFMRMLEIKLLPLWRMPRTSGRGYAPRRGQVVCNWLMVKPDGHFASIHVSQSSGDKDQDFAALQAVVTLNKFVFPPGSNEREIEVEYTFR